MRLPGYGRQAGGRVVRHWPPQRRRGSRPLARYSAVGAVPGRAHSRRGWLTSGRRGRGAAGRSSSRGSIEARNGDGPVSVTAECLRRRAAHVRNRCVLARVIATNSSRRSSARSMPPATGAAPPATRAATPRAALAAPGAEPAVPGASLAISGAAPAVPGAALAVPGAALAVSVTAVLGASPAPGAVPSSAEPSPASQGCFPRPGRFPGSQSGNKSRSHPATKTTLNSSPLAA